MNTELLLPALLITALGMGMVFVAILLLWGLMELIVRLLPERAAPAPAAVTVVEAAGEVEASRARAAALEAERENLRRAAAAAVAVAIELERLAALVQHAPDSSYWQIASRTTAMRSLAGYSRPRSSGPAPKDRPR